MVVRRPVRTHSSTQIAAGALPVRRLAAVLLILPMALLTPNPGAAGPCQESARQARKACKFDVKDNFWESVAICTHLSSDGARVACEANAQDARDEGTEECRGIFSGRMDFCSASGEVRYDPSFSAGMFTDVFNNNNPYWPLAVGNRWVLEGDGETVVVEVLNETKRIAGVDCIVVNDVVSDEDGQLIEDTDDWYAYATNNDAWYCGENAKDYEYFPGDQPSVAELVKIDGSFKHGVEGAKAGVQMWASPTPGQIYRQEFSLANAEDGAEVLSSNYSYGDGSGLDRRVPQALAELFCNNDCVVAREFNLSEVGGEALKYYSPGVGIFLEVDGKKVVQLVDCSHDVRCEQL